MNRQALADRVYMSRDEIDAAASKSIGTLTEEKADIIPHYLALQTLGLAIAKLGKESPIVGIDPITMTLIREMSRLNPGTSSRNLTELRIAVGIMPRENDYADRYFEHQDSCDGG